MPSLSTQVAPVALEDADLHEILAKSDPRESLLDHTWHVLSRLADQVRLRPELPDQIGDERLWHRMYWACFLHDFGKAADGFQAVLCGGERWPHRHEALSLAFVDWLFPRGHIDRNAVIAVIACHHKDALLITEHYAPVTDFPEDDPITRLLPEINAMNRERLYRWLYRYGMAWAELIGLGSYVQETPLPDLEKALKMVRPQAVHKAISDLSGYWKTLDLRQRSVEFIQGVILRGLVLTADHAGSAHAESYPQVEFHREHILSPGRDLYPHQHEAATAPTGSVLLIAPTSSGKTEAALLWAAHQTELDGTALARLFYALPYQASMNAMARRLEGVFPEHLVGLQHGHALLALFQKAMDAEADPREATAQARTKQNLAQLNYYPVKVFSPYQMLKAPYALKGYEALLTDYYNGLFILDEIHAYDIKRLALIVELIRLLHRHFRARFFIMTATLPPLVRDVLTEAIPDLHTIEAEQAVFSRFQRHRVHLLSQALQHLDTLACIRSDVEAGRSVLVCCNTVRRAREMHSALAQYLRIAPDDLVLIHSRFNGRDRAMKEKEIQDRVSVGAKNRHPLIVVATQVVEVSLNIDLDTLYSEPAPLEALLQRFGRVNRGRPAGSPLADVYVMREFDGKIYDPALVDATLAILSQERVNGYPVDEGLVNAWLARIYSGDIAERWEQVYRPTAHEFWEGVISSMHPFQSADEYTFQRFNELFDGTEVLPLSLEGEFEARWNRGEYISALELLVPMAWRDVAILTRAGHAWPREGRFYQVVDVDYDPGSGLNLESAYAHPAPQEAD